MKACPARFILGLTATPRRKDGLQKLLHFQCGPIRHHFTPSAPPPNTPIPRRLVIRHCLPDLPALDAPIHQFWTALVTSRARNEQIAADIAACLREGRAIAVLSDRREHLANLQAHTVRLFAELSEAAPAQAPASPALHRIDGATGRRERAATLAELSRLAEAGAGFALFTTASLLGEGFDLPRLDTLFLTTPVSLSGRVVQYAGRLHRAHAAKTEVRIYDYHEPAHRLSAHMHRKRLAVFRALGYTADSPAPHAWPSLI